MMQSKPLALVWGERVRETRLSQGLSLETLADRAGVDLAHLSRGERGLAGFGDATRMRLARALGRQVADLFPYPDTTPETRCPSAAPAVGAAPSRTPARAAARRSPAPNATAQDASAHAGSHGSERRPA